MVTDDADSLAQGRYEILAELGRSRHTVVYRVHDNWFDTQRALKMLLADPSNEKITHRFTHEARLMSALSHSNLLKVRDIGEDYGRPYFVMDYCKGGSLAMYLRRHGPRTDIEAAAIVIQALVGLEHAHEQGLVHRDIKPHNLLFEHVPAAGSFPLKGENGLPQVVKLMDFGIARLIAMGGLSRVTGTHDMLGSLAYMAPEQKADPRTAGPKADLFGMGAILFAMTTGRPPFNMSMITARPALLQAVPQSLHEVLLRCAQLKPDDRYASAKEMSEALQTVLPSI